MDSSQGCGLTFKEEIIGMRINHNIAALNTYRQLNSASNAQSNSMEKLSSGLRINKAGDDAAGLAISEKMRGQIRGLDMASKNAQDGISLIQTAEGALNETHSILQRMRELSVQSANDTNTDDDRAELQKEISQLQTEVTRIAENTEFNTKTLMNGDLGVTADGALTNTLNASSVKITELGDLADGDTFDITQEVVHAADSGGGTGDGAFQTIDFNIDLGGGNTGSVQFTKADLDAGITSKEATVNGTKMTISVKDASTLSSSTGDGAVGETSADTVTIDDNSLNFHIGANDGQNIKLAIGDMSSDGLNISGVNISTQAGADSAIATLDEAIKSVSQERSKLGAYQNRLDHTINNLNTSSENLTAAESRIRDVDYALAA
jgi:flagellin